MRVKHYKIPIKRLKQNIYFFLEKQEETTALPNNENIKKAVKCKG